MKRYGAVSAVCRDRIEEFDDHLMLTATGLWNFYLMATIPGMFGNMPPEIQQQAAASSPFDICATGGAKS